MSRRASGQRGAAAIAAVFLVVGLAALGAYMLTFSNAQQLGSAQDVQGSRAYWAARAGLEWGVAQTTCPASFADFEVEGFTVTVQCSQGSYTEGADSIAIVRLTSTARQGSVGTVAYVERSVSATLERAP